MLLIFLFLDSILLLNAIGINACFCWSLVKSECLIMVVELFLRLSKLDYFIFSIFLHFTQGYLFKLVLHST